MKITNCVPLAGQGVVARYGGLVAVTDGRGADPDPLLSAVAETVKAGGDGSDLVIRVAREALGAYREASWACAGPTVDGGVATLVYGHAAATVRVEGQPEVTLTVSDLMLPVSRVFAGKTVTAILVIGGAAPPDERFWLGEGVVPGGGIAVTLAVQDDHPPTTGKPGVGSPQVNAAPANARQASVAPVNAAPANAAPLSAPVGAVVSSEDDRGIVLVDGVLCPNAHFNDPSAVYCRQCGVGLEQPPRHIERRPRPSLGELIVDDGTRITLDGDYVLGREPALDGDVLAGRARPVRISDPNGTVSRLHLKVTLVGWQVEISDLGSANGSVLHLPDGERTLTPFQPATIEPGARIAIGHRSMQYLA